MNANSISLIPRVSEKAYGLSQSDTYVFKVPLNVNKQQIAAAVAAQYGVTVKTVNVIVAKGKVVRSARKRAQPTRGKRNDFKKAYVRLAEGDSIKIFDEETK